MAWLTEKNRGKQPKPGRITSKEPRSTGPVGLYRQIPMKVIVKTPLQREMKRIAAQSLKELQDGRENEHQLEPIREDHGTFSPRLAFFGTRHGVFGHDRAVRTPASDKRCTSNKRPVDAASNPITQRLPPEEDRHLCGFVLLDVIVCRLSSEG
jgi:hypothetical protein